MHAASSGDQLGQAAGFELQHMRNERRGQGIALAPAQAASLQRVLRLGVGDRQLREVLPLQHALTQSLRTFPGGITLPRGGIERRADENVRHEILPVRLLPRFGSAKEVVHLPGVEIHAGNHIALPERVQRDLRPQFLAVLGIRDPLLGQHVRKIAQLDLVLPGHEAERPVDLLVGNLDAEAFGALQLYFPQHKPLQHLGFQHRGRRRSQALGANARAYAGQFLIQFAPEDNAVIDHRGDAVEKLALIAELRPGRPGNRRQENRKEQDGHGRRPPAKVQTNQVLEAHGAYGATGHRLG